MKSVLQAIIEKNNEQIDSAWVVGAGNGNDLESYRELRSKNIYFIEAHPRQAEFLARKIDEPNGESLISVAITADELDAVSLLTFNNVAYSSVHQPLDLLNYYPNLRPSETISVPAKSITRLFNERTLDSDKNNVLVLDVSGQSFNLIKAMQLNQLHAFSWLIVSSYNEPFYQNDADAKEIADWLKSVGFDLVAEDCEAIYPLNRQLFSRNPKVIQKRLQQELNYVRTQLEMFQKDSQRKLNELTVSVQSLTKEKFDLIDARDAQAQLVAECQAQIEALTKEKFDLIGARDAQVQLVAECKAQVDTLNSDNKRLIQSLDESNQALTAAQQKINSNEGEILGLTRRQQAMQEELIKAEAQLGLIKELIFSDADDSDLDVSEDA